MEEFTQAKDKFVRMYAAILKMTPYDRNLEAKLKDMTSVRIVFLMDCTGSMGTYITEAREKIFQISSKVTDIFNQTTPPSIGFVGYRDLDDGDDRFHIIQPTASLEKSKDAIGKVTAKGGGDEPEDVLGGLRECTKIKWEESRIRVVVHIYDAPPHGNEYRDEGQTYQDDHPAGEPENNNLETIFKKFNELQIDYYMLPVCSGMEKMFEVFSNTYERERNKKLCKFETNVETFVKAIIRSVEISITGEIVEFDDVPLIPVGSNTKLDSSNSTSFPNSYIFTESSDSKPEKVCTVNIMNQAFGSGSMRYAYLATIEGEKQLFVAKQWKTSSTNSLKRSTEQLKCHQVAIKYAELFNSKLAHIGETQRLKFLGVRLLLIDKNDKEEYFTLEDYIPGDYVKFNNNYNFVNSDYDDYPIFQCFSHFTFLESKGKEMVVDIQGVIDEEDKVHVLTDPAVHALGTMKEYGMGDLANLGMKAFNCVHRCRDLCSKFGYISLASLFTQEEKQIMLTTKVRDDPLCFICMDELSTKPISRFAPCGHSLHKECLNAMKKKKVFKGYCNLCTLKVDLDYEC